MMHPNVHAFLDMLAWSEIGPEMLAASDNGYDVIVGSTPGRMIRMQSYEDHPNVQVDWMNSDAAGRYQIMARYWPHYKAQLGLRDFGHDAQDAYAVQQLREQRALPLIHVGKINEAIAKVANIWASLPGAGYGQHEHKMAGLRDAYTKAGGKLA